MHLYNKLNFTNPTSTKLNVVIQALLPHFALDQQLHFTQAFKRAIIQIPTKYKRLKALYKPLTAANIPGHGTHFDEGITLPFSPLLLVITRQAIKATHQRSRITPRSQTHIHTIHKAFRRRMIEQANQGLP